MARAVLEGLAGSPGVGVGRALLVPERPSVHATESAEPASGAPRGAPAVDPAVEGARLRCAIDAVAAELAEIAARTATIATEDVGAILGAQALLARDPALVEPALEQVARGVPGAEAILAAATAQADRLAALDDPYIRARSADVRDVGRLVADRLEGREPVRLWRDDGAPCVLVAPDLAPSEVATLRRELVAGICCAGGAPTGHTAILARALGLPLVMGLGSDALRIPADALVAVDGFRGRVLVEPDADEIAEVKAVPAAPAEVVASGPLPMAVLANVGSVGEADAAARAGAEGIGLVRTELLFHGRPSPPSVDEQRGTYAAIRRAVGDRAVVFRTLDIGGDKPVAWLHERPEPNPALGVRGIRLSLRRPELFEGQVRALAQAADGGELRLMLPMVSEAREVVAARERIEAVLAGLAGPRPRLALGAMVEVPSAAIMAGTLVPLVDFVSIGTNDLVQYTLAADRTNAELAHLASAFQPAVLRLVAGVVDAARAGGRPVAVCGEAAADPGMLWLLCGLGVMEVSVAPASIASVRATLAAVDPERARRLAREALTATSADEVRRVLASVAGPA